MASTEAMATRCFSPPDSVPRDRAREPAMPTAARDLSMAFSISAGARRRFSRPKAISSSTVSVQNWESGSWKTRPVCCGQKVYGGLPDHQAGHDHLSLVVAFDQVRDEPVEAQGESALARTAGTEHEHGLPGPERDVQTFQSRLLPRGVGETETRGADYWRRCGRGQILWGGLRAIPSPDRTPVLARARPRPWDRPAPSTSELSTVMMPARRMLPQL